MKAFENSKFIWFERDSSPDSYGEFFPILCYEDGDCVFRISCDGDYTLFVNGRYASSNQYGDFEHYKVFDEIDISPFLQTGENSLYILVWHFGIDTQRYKKYKPGVIFEAMCNDRIVLTSDKTTPSRKSAHYKSGRCRRISSQLGLSYEYDNRDKNEETPHSSYIIEKKCIFAPRPNKKLCLGDFVGGSEIYNDGKRIIFDLGKEYLGLLSFEIEAKAGCEINIAHAEHLENGFVPRRIHDRDFSIDFIAKKGTNAYTNYMLRHACRYLEISTPGQVFVRKIGIIPQYYPTARQEVSIKNEFDRQIYDICLNTLELSMMEHYVDCPWREQCLYAYDSRNQMLSGYYAFKDGNFEYARSNLLLMSKDERQDGLLSICFPCGTNLTIPSFCLYYIIALWEYLSQTGDKSLIFEIRDKIERILEAFISNKSGEGVSRFFGNDYWNFYDWSEGADGYSDYKGDFDPLLNLIFLLAVKAYGNICTYCNIENKLSINKSLLISKIKEQFFNQDTELWEMNGIASELVNSLAILSCASSGQEAEHICRALSDGKLAPCSLSMKCFKYDALLKFGTQYNNSVLEEIRRTYSPMIETGTVWETAKGSVDFDGAGSLCHGWSAIPIYYYHKLGIATKK